MVALLIVIGDRDAAPDKRAEPGAEGKGNRGTEGFKPARLYFTANRPLHLRSGPNSFPGRTWTSRER